ncbi:hypothetical protein K432DRAFT_271186, partial [Lepidopterella palustris CBS 459.81]
KTWRPMLKYPYLEGFKLAAMKEYKNLERRGTWKYKARLCVRSHLQTTDEETYAATLAARMFRVRMVIAAVFNLEIRQY